MDISVPTVRAAQALLAQDGAVIIRHGSGVYVAERAGGGRIGILSELNLLDPRIGPFFRAEADAFKTQLQQRGAEPLLYVGDAIPGSMPDESSCPRFWHDAATHRLDGAIILNGPSSLPWQERVKSCPVPTVGSATDVNIRIDMAGLISSMVSRLRNSGRHRLGLISWHWDDEFRRALREHGLQINDAWIRSDLDPALRGTGWDEFREIWLAQHEKPDGLIILDDMLYADAQPAIFDLGIRVPHDLQLAVQTTRGATGPFRLPVTAFELDPAETAAAHIDLLFDLMAGKPPGDEAPIIRFHERNEPAATVTVEAGAPAAASGNRPLKALRIESGAKRTERRATCT